MKRIKISNCMLIKLKQNLEIYMSKYETTMKVFWFKLFFYWTFY